MVKGKFTFFRGTIRDTLKKSRGKNLIIVPLVKRIGNFARS